MSSKIAVVLGAKGGTGKEIVARLLDQSAAKISEIRAVVRDTSQVDIATLYGDKEDDGRIKLVSGDVTNLDPLRPVFEGANFIYNSTSASASKSESILAKVDRDAVGNTAQLAKEICSDTLERYVLVSSQFVHPDNKWHPVRIMLNTLTVGVFAKEGIMDFKWQGEELLRSSGIPYTIVRPGQLTDGKLHNGTIIVGQTNAGLENGAGSSRADIAAVCVAAATADATKNTTFEVGTAKGSSSEGQGPVTEELFADMKAHYLESK